MVKFDNHLLWKLVTQSIVTCPRRLVLVLGFSVWMISEDVTGNWTAVDVSAAV